MNEDLNSDILNAFLEKLVPDDRSRMLLKNIFLSGQKEAEMSAIQQAKAKGLTLDKAVEDVKKLLSINKAWKVHLTELKTEYVKLVEKFRRLASALGACECLGENPICPLCQGKGIPGSRKIEEKPFFQYVYPLIQRITQATELETKLKEENAKNN